MFLPFRKKFSISEGVCSLIKVILAVDLGHFELSSFNQSGPKSHFSRGFPLDNSLAVQPFVGKSAGLSIPLT
jgi:hypothetical protein